MKTNLIPLAIIFGFLNAGIMIAQDNSQAKRAAYDRCAEAMSYNHLSGYRLCKDYLARYADDQQEHVERASKWLTAYEHALRYAKDLSSLSTSNPQHDWFIYEPDLNGELQEVVEKDDQYKIEIVYTFKSPLEAAMLKKAEAIYGSQQRFIQM